MNTDILNTEILKNGFDDTNFNDTNIKTKAHANKKALKKVAIIHPLESDLQLDLISGSMYMPRLGTISIATCIRNAGYETLLFCEHNGVEIDWDFVKSADYVCFSLMSFNSARGYKLAARVREMTSAPVIFGGSHVSSLPHESSEHCDYVVRNEGETSIVELLKVLDEGGSLETVAGVGYKKNGQLILNEPRKFIRDLDWEVDYTLMPGYKRPGLISSLLSGLGFSNKKLYHPVVQTSRGCPRNCTFCFGKRELGRSYRKREITNIVKEVEWISKNIAVPNIMIVDNDFCVNKKHTLRVLNAVKENISRPLRFTVFSRVETGHDEEFVSQLKKLQVYNVMLGLESINESTLSLYNKEQGNAEMEKAIRSFQKAKINVTAFFVLGADTDTLETVRETIRYALKFKFMMSCFFILYDFPNQFERFGEYQMIDNRYFIHKDWRFFNSNFAIHFPKKIKPSSLQKEIIKAYKTYYNIKRFVWSHMNMTSFVARRSALKLVKTMEKYVVLLEELEDGFYDENENRIEEKFQERTVKIETLAI